MICTRASFAFLGLIVGCGGSGEAGEPLVSGAVSASYDGHAFTPTFGFATIYQGSGLIGLGDRAIHCGTETASAPPPGSSIVVQVPALDVGTYPSTSVQMFRNVDNFEGIGATGDAMITASDTSTLTASLTFSYTDSSSRVFSASGTFEVVRCPQ